MPGVTTGTDGSTSSVKKAPVQTSPKELTPSTLDTACGDDRKPIAGNGDDVESLFYSAKSVISAFLRQHEVSPPEKAIEVVNFALGMLP